MNKRLITATLIIITFVYLAIGSEGRSAIMANKSSSAPKHITVAHKLKPEVCVIVSSDDELMQRTGQWCRNFLSKRGYSVNAEVSSQVIEGLSPVWILETLDNHPIAESFGLKCAIPESCNRDSYTLNIALIKNRPVVSIIGCGSAGVRAGTARLIAILADGPDTLTAPETSETNTPFFATRRLHVCTTGRIAQGNEWCISTGLPASYKTWADTLWTNWADQRIREYAEQLWLLGFNSIETLECRGYRGVFSDEELKNEITPKLRVFMQAVRDNGMQVSQFIWGQSLFKEGNNLCWNSPEERKIMENEFTRLAHAYGDLVDHIVVHVGDPGGCDRNGCDPYKTTQEIAVYLSNAYRKINPKVTVTLSTWANEGFWNGREGDKFLDESYSSKDMAIALHRWYDPDKAKTVKNAGRDCDIWGWYLSDFEMVLDMSLFMQRLDKYFSSLPDRASTDIRAISTEINFQGWPQIINAYVSAQKMWAPHRSLDDIEREFCAGTFGDKNADAMAAVYKACEAFVHPERYYGFIPPSDCLPEVFGTAEYNQQLRSAIEAAKSVSFDWKYPPRFTSATDPQALKDYLLRDLVLISIFSEAQETINSAIKSGASKEELQKIIDKAEKDAAPYSNELDFEPLRSKLASSIKQL